MAEMKPELVVVVPGELSAPEELYDGAALFAEIERGLEGNKTRLFSGAPAWLGPQFIKLNEFGPECGFNPLFYMCMLLVVGVVTLIVAYSGDE